ncbi:hypothetical protein LCGC14_2070210 [marine sediment metagenome]|uniref:THIF-type NAD/FAD binding fold domain-containing protein n=1 Tax=marine sediment metagenome TaxID=412755 RepID=A0A0F9HFP5_9ZZZZ
MPLNDTQIERYSRHIILQEVGGTGQEKLLDSKVLIVGAGGLGAPAALYLAAAGIGTLGLIDADTVDITNLQRQVIHHTDDIGVDKVRSAENKIRAINPDVTVNTYKTWAKADNIAEIVADYDCRSRCRDESINLRPRRHDFRQNVIAIGISRVDIVADDVVLKREHPGASKTRTSVDDEVPVGLTLEKMTRKNTSSTRGSFLLDSLASEDNRVSHC